MAVLAALVQLLPAGRVWRGPGVRHANEHCKCNNGGDGSEPEHLMPHVTRPTTYL